MKQLYEKVDELTKYFNLELAPIVKRSTEINRPQLYSDYPFTHTFEFPCDKNESGCELLVARAKVNEMCEGNMQTLNIKTINPILFRQIHLFEEIGKILVEYWAFTLAIKAMSQETIVYEFKRLEKELNDTALDSYRRLQAFVILERFDRVTEFCEWGKSGYRIIDGVAKYGSKEPCLYYITEFFNSLKLDSNAVRTARGEIVITLPSPANVF